MNNKKEKKILVTGGAGFIGSNLCDYLLKKLDQEIICLDNLYTGSEDNIKLFLKNDKFSFLKNDVTNDINLDVSRIYNLACPASPVHYQKNPTITTKTCVIGAINILELAKQKNAKVVQASTSEIYGDPKVHPQHEEYWGNVNPIGIRSCYDEGKRCAETIFYDYYRQYSLNISVVRIFNTYGPRMHPNDGRVVSNFIMQALKGEDITIYGNGTQTRSFCYIDDMIKILYKVMFEKDIAIPLNVGNPVEFTISELAEKVLKLTKSKSKLIFKKIPEDDPIKRKPSIEKVKKIFKWEPKVSLDDGLKETINYFSKRL